MTRDDILAIFARRDAAWRNRDLAGLVQDFSSDAVVISPTGGVLEGREDIERVYGIWMQAFPDLQVSREALLVDGDQAAEICKLRGTQSGEFFGLPPTGRHVEVNAIFVCTLKDGAIVHERRILDFTGVLIQVGVLKARPA